MYKRQPLLHDWLELGQAAIHPIQPDVMDICAVRKTMSPRVGIVGNVPMDLLVHGAPEEVKALVRERMQYLKPSVNYIISSSNSITDDMQPDNVRAMISAVREYGRYY